MEISWKRNLWVISLSQFLAMAGFGCCMPFIPLLLKSNLHVDNDQVRGLYVSIYYLTGMLSLTVAYPIWGTLADKFGRKLMLLRASYGAALIYPLLAFAPNFWTLVAIRFGASLFSGTVNPAQTLLITTLPKEKHGMALGWMATAIHSGEMAGYLMGGLMVDYFGYVAAFLSCGLIYMLSGVLVHALVRENFIRPVLGTVVAKKKKAKLSSLLTPAVGWLLVMFLLMGIARRIETPFIAMLVEKINGPERAATYTGITSSIAALGGVVAGILVGRLSNKYAPRNLLLPVLFFSGISLLVQAFAVNIYMLYVGRFCAFAVVGCLQPLLQVMLTKITPSEKHGSYLGWTASLNSGGGIICNFISAPLAYYIGVRGIFVASGVIFFIMLPMLIPLLKTYKKELFAREAASSI